MQVEKFSYDNKIVRMFIIAIAIWGLVGMLVGLIIATQLFIPNLTLDFMTAIGLDEGAQYLVYSRLRALHTNAVIFAFVGNGIFAGVYYSMQRLLKTRMFSDLLSRINFWGWQLIIVLAAITLPAGFTTSKEYAELEWPIDILITVIWVVFGINMIGTILRRREKHMYVAIWFYIATFVTVAVLHLVNSFALPVGMLKSYSWYAGVQDALVQWWYGHNAVAFFLTTPYLGLMYYFVPKAANRPIYSYKLSIIHFWALIFIYIWAGPHHLLYTSLPGWAQSLGVVFSFMLIAPSWGGMLNGILTLRGAWDKVREDPVLKFMVVAITAYGMSTLEGPLLSLKNVNALFHYTDWIIAHVHIGGLGWNGFLTFGMLYWLVPKMWKTKLWSTKLANFHFWIGTLGIIFYALSMYWSGITQTSMWKEFTEEGFIAYTNFLDTVTQLVPMYIGRALGGGLFFIGAVAMVVNLVKTMKQGTFLANEEDEAPALEKKKHHDGYWHRALERKPVLFTVLTLVAVIIGGIVEMVPTFLIKSNVPTIASVKPYRPLELEGRDIYIREACNACHSQMIRPFRWETERFGEYSKAGEFVYDHPFLWGSKRTGPDLHREGGLRNNTWHFNHMMDPTSTSPGSLMPAYPWLYTRYYDKSEMPGKIRAMRTLGVPYSEGFENEAIADMEAQAAEIVADLKSEGNTVDPNLDIVALISYLQRLGTDIKVKEEVPAKDPDVVAEN
ncbi:MAG: cytochrome-c oxidase, cbb3-type subunit I [Cyclobacteriaceae bacterium]